MTTKPANSNVEDMPERPFEGADFGGLIDFIAAKLVAGYGLEND